MSNFVRVQIVSQIEHGREFAKSETVKEWQWINLDHVTNYHEPSSHLFFADDSRVTVAEESEPTLLWSMQRSTPHLRK